MALTNHAKFREMSLEDMVAVIENCRVFCEKAGRLPYLYYVQGDDPADRDGKACPCGIVGTALNTARYLQSDTGIRSECYRSCIAVETVWEYRERENKEIEVIFNVFKKDDYYRKLLGTDKAVERGN